MSEILNKIKYAVLVIGDVGIFYLSLWLALLIRYQQAVTPERWQQHFLPFSFIFLVWLAIFYITGIYSLQIARNNLFFYTTFIKGLIWAAAVAMAFFYLIKPGIAPKTNLLLELVILSLLLVLWRQVFNALVGIKYWRNNLLIIGLNETTFNLAQEINNKPQFGFKVAAIVSNEMSEADEKWLAKKESFEIISTPHSLAGLVKIKKIKGVVTALNHHQNPELVSQLYECLPLKISFWDLPTFIEKFTGKIPVNAVGQVWFLENFKESQKAFYEVSKRVFDFFVSIILLIISLPFIPLLYLIVKMDSKGPFFFMQQRTGRFGKKFMAIKIRTMHKNAETNGPQWAQKDDPRVTKVGKFMRKTRIDEIPQLVNILRGEMSFIGPRPERPEFIEKLEKKIPFYRERLLVKPGLTGWAQINFPYGASEEDALQKLQYDLYYIKNRSLMLDLSILLKTIKTVLSGGGQ
jgi:exopolysaccharide biosynthesis polyprenyl glycosylphosphotransferase